MHTKKAALTERTRLRRLRQAAAACIGVAASALALGALTGGLRGLSAREASPAASQGLERASLGGAEAASYSSPLGESYSLVTTGGSLVGFGAAVSGALSTPPNRPVVGAAPTSDGKGAWAVASDGGVFSFGDARFYGSTGAMHLNKPVVGIAATPDGGGYWLVASDGGVFSFGDARFYGSTGAMHLNKPVVGIAATPDGGGYWLVASDGGVFSFGDAGFYGSATGSGQQVAGMAAEAGGYQNPLRAVSHLTPLRVDQGVDYSGSGPVYALGDGVVLNTTNPGWPGGAFISYQLTDGPAAGDIVYVAENLLPQVSVGQRVTPDTVLGILVDAYPDMETGWAAPPGGGEALARAMGEWTSYDDSSSLPSAYGENFSQLLAALGAPAGISEGPVEGSLAPGWPSW